ncbi:UDP-2,3-diacylglucosamine diphosphatase [bacterium]|nr:UDP-2,3-diacylglucosamine diphosphatase [bacterium]
MQKIYFISDVHLGIESQDKEDYKEKQLLDLLKIVEKDATMLVIVGDLFDFWFDYRWVIPRPYLSIIIALKRLTDLGVKVLYCIGNHDFWLGTFFSKDLNISVYKGPLIINADGQRFYISHGDGLNKKDIGYRLLKIILRSPLTSAVCRLLHPDLIFSMARWFSSLSRGCRPDHDHSDPYVKKAMSLFGDGYDYVIFGHTHDPMTVNQGSHVYINTGEWMEQFTYAVYQKKHLQLKYWMKESVNEKKKKNV